MATNRKLVFRNAEIYHIFNRGIERKSIFSNKREFDRAQKLIKFYRHKDIPIRFSQLIQQPEEAKKNMLEKLYKSEKLVDILSYCLMPNHFHFILKQNVDKGITTFVANFTNAYTRYFNTKIQRAGPLFEGTFKAVYVESDEQLIHLSRYIHLNPVVSSIIKIEQLDSYLWSSYPEYISLLNENIAEKELVLRMFKSNIDYKRFVMDQISYAKELEHVKHLTLE
ncbi:MAG: transposase [Patescibacteria group bacterium]|nr:transposase [Patescibacteria group bacterium]